MSAYKPSGTGFDARPERLLHLGHASSSEKQRAQAYAAALQRGAGRTWLAAATAILLVFASVHGSLAATITKKNNSFTLNTKRSWTGAVPTSADIVLWDTTVNGANTTSLGANVSWQGIQITNPGGLVTINSGNTLTLGTSGIDMSSATVDFALNCAVVLDSSQTWSTSSGHTLTASGIISGSSNLTKNGLGTLTLSGANTYSGSTTINAGTLSVTNASALGTGTLTINPTGIFQATSSFSSARAIVLGGTGGAASGGTLDVASGITETRTGIISGGGSLTKTGAGILALSAADTFTGDTYVDGGTLSIGNNQALGPLPPSLGSTLYAIHMASGTTLQNTISSTGDNRQLQLSGGTATVDITTAVSHQRNGLVYGSGGLIKSGAGTEILTNANTYTGGTTVNAGILQVNNSTGSGTGTGSVAVNSGGTLSGLPTATAFASAGTISGTVTVNSGGALQAQSGSTFTFGGLTLNAGAISNFQLGASTTSSLINLTNSNGLSLAGLSTINISNGGSLAAGTYHLFDYTGTALGSISNLQLGSTPGSGFTYALSNNISNTSIDLLVSTSNAQWGVDQNGNWSLATNWSNGAAPNAMGAQANFFGLISTARTVTVDGAFKTGSLSFNNANAYTIATDGVAGHGLTLSNGGTASIGVVAGSHTISAPLALADNLDVSAAASTSLTISGAITENSAGRTLTNRGAGTVTLSGTTANTYTGLTAVTAGTLNLGKTSGVDAIGTGGLRVDSGSTVALLASNQIADTATATVNGALALGTFSETIGALTGSGTVTTGASSLLTVGASNNLTSQFDGVISGAGTITKVGTGTLTLNGVNTFGGAGQTVSLNGGSLQTGADSAFGNAANSITFNGGTLLYSGGFNSSRAIALTGSGSIDTGSNLATLSGVISGSGGLNKAGTGSLTVSGTNTYTGGTTINAGTAIVSSASNLGAPSGALTINGGTLEVATGFSSARNVSLGNAASTIQVDAAQTYTASGVLSGSGTLNKTGTGTLQLTGANTFTGDTVVDGTLIAAAASGSALASTATITVNSGGTLLLGANNQIDDTASVTLNGGTFSKGNFSEGSTTSAGMGALTLATSVSHLDFGTGVVGTLSFASLSNLDGLALIIDGWTGTANTIGGPSTDHLVFNTSPTSAELLLFDFVGYADGANAIKNGSFYEIVPITPVPEPSTWVAAGMGLLLCAFGQRKRLRTLLIRQAKRTLASG